MMNFHFLACELSNVGVIPLGHTGEHNATRVTIDATEWQEEYPNGALALLVRNPNGIVYPAQVETNGYVLTWNVTRDETAIAGNGEIELILSADGYVVKSARCTTQIDAALSQNADDPPTGTPEWVTELLGSLDNIKDANDTIEAAKTAADAAADAAKAANEAAKASVYSPYIDTATQNWMVWSTETKAYKDTGIKAVGPQGETGPKGETGSIENLTINGKTPDASGAMTLRPDDLGAATAEEVSQLKEQKADKAGWAINKIIGTDENGNMVAVDAPEGNGGDADTLGGVAAEEYAQKILISDAYDPTRETYVAGDYCVYGNKLYKRKIDASGAEPIFLPDNWKEVKLATELRSISTPNYGLNAIVIPPGTSILQFPSFVDNYSVRFAIVDKSSDIVDWDTNMPNVNYANIMINRYGSTCMSVFFGCDPPTGEPVVVMVANVANSLIKWKRII